MTKNKYFLWFIWKVNLLKVEESGRYTYLKLNNVEGKSGINKVKGILQKVE